MTNALLESASASRELVVAANRLPQASFTSSPPNPVVGAPVTFRSTSRDPDGRVVSHAWDLDNDGAFDDGSDIEDDRRDRRRPERRYVTRAGAGRRGRSSGRGR